MFQRIFKSSMVGCVILFVGIIPRATLDIFDKINKELEKGTSEF
jgi:hypothetical protein